MTITSSAYWRIYFYVFICSFTAFCVTIIPPLDVHITSLQRPLSAGQEVKLICQSTGSQPPASLTWWLGSKQLMNAQTSSSAEISLSIISFVPVMEDHLKVLSCRSLNPVLKGRILEDHWILNIFYTPQLSVTVGTPNQRIKEGDDVYFECNVQANPAVSEVRWKYNGKTLYAHMTTGVKVNNESLLLREVMKENSGYYSCVAANVEGEGASKNVYLNIEYVPYCQPNQKQSFVVPFRQSVQVKCSVFANPSNVVFMWYKNTTAAKSVLKQYVTNGTDSCVTFTPKHKTDYGYLFCHAHNIVGEQYKPCYFKVSPASIPSKVHNCVVENETFSAIEISCQPGFDGGLPQKFHLELYNTKGLFTSLSNKEIPIFNLSGLSSGVSYIAVIFSTNYYGRSNSVALTAQTLHYSSHGDIKDAFISPILAVVISLVSSLVFIAIVIAIRICQKDCTIKNANHIYTM